MQEADAKPNDAALQARFYKELLKHGEQKEVVSRIESGKFSTSDEVAAIYLKSIANVDVSDKEVAKLKGLLGKQGGVSGNSVTDVLQVSVVESMNIQY